MSESVANIRQERILEKAFRSKPSGENGDEDGGCDSDDGRDEQDDDAAPEETSVVFDERTMRLIQMQFNALEQSHEGDKKPHKHGCIRCSVLPRLVGVVGLQVPERQLREFLDEIGATQDTLVSFAECVDILSLLAESEMGGRDEQGGAEDDNDDDDDEEEED